MAFFGLTQLGYQNPIRQSVSRPDFSAEELHIREQKPGGTDIVPLPPIRGYVPPKRSTIPINQTSQYGPGPDSSWVEYMRLRTKHCRNPADLQQTFRIPPATSQDYGYLVREKDDWAYVPRFVHVNSEMTRFVHDMKLTNREFSLY